VAVVQGTMRGCCGTILGALAALAIARPAGADLPDARIEADAPFARLGLGAASAGDVNGDGYEDAVAGAPFSDGAGSSRGAAYVFLGGPGGLASGAAAGAATVLTCDQDEARFGMSVAGAGDVNGDGYDDLLVGAPGYDAGQAEEGVFYLYLGGAGGIPSGGPEVAAARLEADWPNARLGTSVASAGDVNGDGYDDVVSGARLYQSEGAQTNEGEALVFLGGPGGIMSGGAATAHAQVQANQGDSYLGDAVGGGDVNGDGYGDVVIGSPRYDAPDVREGAVFVFHGGPSGIASGGPEQADAQLEAEQTDAQLGTSVATSDVNGDGYDDVVTGAPRWSGGQDKEGAVFVFLGGPAGVDGTADARIEGDQVDSVPIGTPNGVQFGAAVAGGDENGDGFGDVLAGAPWYDAGELDEGAAFVFRGSPGGIAIGSAGDADRRLETDRRGGALTGGLALADLAGDGAADVLAGDSFFGAPVPDQQAEGALLVFRSAPEPDAGALALGAASALCGLSRSVRARAS
jgi:hypothetical protein